MSESDAPDLETVLDGSDAALRADLGTALAGLDDEAELGQLLVERPALYERLTERMATMDGMDEFATEDTEAVERYLDVLWTGMELIANTVPSVGEAVTVETSVTWEAIDSPVAFHARTDPETGSIEGGTGLLDDPEIAFEGQTDVLFSMLGDDDFNAPLAFVQNRYDVIGSLERARDFAEMMETVSGEMEALA